MRLLGIITVVLLLSSLSVSAIGVARPYIFNNTIFLERDEEYTVTFELQNGGIEPIDVEFAVRAPIPMKLNGDTGNYTEEFMLLSKSRDPVDVEFKSSVDGRYKVEYALRELTDSSGISFNFAAGDSFYIQVGNRSNITNIGIDLVYPDFTLLTESFDIKNVDDLVISCSSGVEVDFTGRTVDLTSFKPEYVDCNVKSIFLNITMMPTFNQKAKLIFYNIKELYTIYRNDVKCSLTDCKSRSYQGKRLTFEVPKFNGTYYIEDEDDDEVKVKTTSTGSTGGFIAQNNTSAAVVNVSKIESSIPKNQTQDQKKEVNLPPQQQNKSQVVQQPVKTSPINTDVLPDKAKPLLSSMLILSIISFVAGCGALFYYIKSYRGA